MGYVHGYESIEQQRLVEQAEYMKDRIILRDVDYSAGGALLEVGCGVAAVLGVLGEAYPRLALAGIDIEETQIDTGRRYLTNRGLGDVDLRVGDASSLPWEDESFDHVYMIWFLEHLPDSRAYLIEARRVLKPGGTITITEPDYDSFRTWPTSPDYRYYVEAQRDLFAMSGNPLIGRMLGAVLTETDWRGVRANPIGFHYFYGQDGDELRQYMEYAVEFMEPMVVRLVEQLGRDEGRLRRGVEFFRDLPNQPGASLTQLVYRATATN